MEKLIAIDFNDFLKMEFPDTLESRIGNCLYEMRWEVDIDNPRHNHFKIHKDTAWDILEALRFPYIRKEIAKTIACHINEVKK